MEATNGSSSPHLNGQEFTRDQDLWLEDGDMVFSAETKVFRVRGRQLASISSVFGAMLSFPQPDPVDTFDTYPLTRMQDSAEDVTCFFKSIFIPAYFAPPPVHTDVKTLIAVLRLAHKYEAISLSHCALLHLATAYPTKLRAWDSRNETRTFPPCRLFSEEFQLLRLAYKHGATWTLPSLFYGCSAYPMNEILDSPVWTEADDLTLEKTLCLLGYAEQFSSSHRVTRFLLLPAPPQCTETQKCYPNKQTWLRVVDTWRRSIPLEIWDEGNWKQLMGQVCAACIGQSRRVHQEARMAVWENLPRTYRLPPWDQLEAQKLEAQKAVAFNSEK